MAVDSDDILVGWPLAAKLEVLRQFLAQRLSAMSMVDIDWATMRIRHTPLCGIFIENGKTEADRRLCRRASAAAGATMHSFELLHEDCNHSS